MYPYKYNLHEQTHTNNSLIFVEYQFSWYLLVSLNHWT